VLDASTRRADPAQHRISSALDVKSRPQEPRFDRVPPCGWIASTRVQQVDENGISAIGRNAAGGGVSFAERTLRLGGRYARTWPKKRRCRAHAHDSDDGTRIARPMISRTAPRDILLARLRCPLALQRARCQHYKRAPVAPGRAGPRHLQLFHCIDSSCRPRVLRIFPCFTAITRRGCLTAISRASPGARCPDRIGGFARFSGSRRCIALSS